MSTPVVCNTLVPGVCHSYSGLFVELRDHHCQDTAAEILVRSAKENLKDCQTVCRECPSSYCSRLIAATARFVSFVRKLKIPARCAVPFCGWRRCADRQHRAGRSWSSEKHFDSRGIRAARSDRLPHFAAQRVHSPPQQLTRKRVIFREPRSLERSLAIRESSRLTFDLQFPAC